MGLEPVRADLRAFLHGETEAATFRHADHVRMAFEIVRRHDFVDAARAYSNGLKRIATRAGNPAAYHETITLGFLSLIAERVAEFSYASFDDFAAAHRELLDKKALARWYTPKRLASAAARKTFLLPEPCR